MFRARNFACEEDMQINITTRHYTADDVTKQYLNEKLQRLERFFSRIITARAVLIREGYRHIAEIALSARNMQLVAKEAAEDMHSAVDLAVAKLQKQLTRFRDRTKEHRGRIPDEPRTF
jgi:putative sigma-54 modulation protein